ncbi:MAG: hypothetical protein KDH20_02175 [Rhodocyclaceae bacterium]|nr:hypothetical protein [Rhodocyclaceae bacterium]
MIDISAARQALGRASIRLPDPVPDHPLTRGRRELGRGEYSIVLEADSPERVLKVVSSPADYFLYTADDRPVGPHFPTVFSDHGTIGRAESGYPFHLLEMEKLYPLEPGSEAAALARELVEAYWIGCQKWVQLGSNMGRIALYHMVQGPQVVSDSLHTALRGLSDFIEEYQVLPDILNQDNIMMRRDGTLVFSDPVFIG